MSDPTASKTWPEDLQQWLKSPRTLPADVGAEFEIAVKEGPDEALAWLYSSIVARQRRRVLGTFFTPTAEVQPMLELWDQTQQRPTHVIDVGAGVGVFTAAAAQRWPTAQVRAVDVNPVTLGLLGARLAQADIGDVGDRVSLVLEDFTTWLPAQPSVPGERRLILGNPPYTRGQLIPAAMRARLVAATDGISGTRASLSAFITALSLKHLGPDDGLCLLLPAQWLESDYAEPMRLHLLALDHRRIELRLAPSELFNDATVDAVVLLVGTQRSRPQPFVVTNWAQAKPTSIDRATATTDGWRSWFDSGAASGPGAPPKGRGSKQLRDLAVVRRGTATGANEFFLLSDKALVEHCLPRSAVMPVIRRLAQHGNRATTATFNELEESERRWLLRVTAANAADEAVAAYLTQGELKGFAARHLCAVRPRHWYDLSNDLVVPDVVVTAMTRGGVRIVENDLGAAITNNLYGWRWKDTVTRKTQKAVLAWLRTGDGQAAMLRLARSQGQGLHKVEPRALADLELPADLFR